MDNILKTNLSILMTTGTGGPRRKGMKQSTWGSVSQRSRGRRQIWRPLRGIICDPLGRVVFFIARHDIDIAILSVCMSVRHVPVSNENGLTYCHNFFTIR